MAAPDPVVTPAAAAFMRRLLRLSEHPRGGVRLEVAPGGCSGLSSRFSVEAAPLPGDTVLELDGLRVFLPPASHALLAGVTVDFGDSATSGGLRFVDPRQAPCSCASAGATPPALASVTVGSLRRVARP